jgi:hypothetical protein
MCVTVTVVTGHSVALNRRSHLFSTMSSLHDVLVHDKCHPVTWPEQRHGQPKMCIRVSKNLALEGQFDPKKGFGLMPLFYLSDLLLW